jgi:FkbM family methyltransferase
MIDIKNSSETLRNFIRGIKKNFYITIVAILFYYALRVFLRIFLGTTTRDKILNSPLIMNFKLPLTLKDGNRVIIRIDDIDNVAEVYGKNVHFKWNPEKEDIIFDAGAHIGLYSIRAARFLNKGQVIAIEPFYENINLLKKNVALNKMNTKIKIIELGLSDNNGYQELFISRAGSGSHSIVDKSVGNKSVKIRTIRLDDLVKKFKLKRLDIIKIDVEGAELKVLRGAKNTLRKFKPKLIIEVHPLLVKLSSIESLLKKYKYKIKKVMYPTSPIIYAE